MCRSHGGATKLSRKAAQERMMELVWPALARLDHLVNDPDTDPAIVVKVVAQILDRAHGAGLNKHASMDVGFAEETPFSVLSQSAFVIMRGEENVIDPADERPALSSGGGDEDDALRDLLDQRERAKEREASTRLNNADHDVVPGRVVDDHLTPDADLFGYPKSKQQRYRDAGYSEHDPDGTQPEEPPYAAYERRVREGLE